MKRSDGLIEITIEKLIEGGKGLGRFNSKPVFVSYVLPGEKVAVRVIDQRRHFMEAELKEILEPSPERISPPCPYFQACGGCQWQHIPYQKQLEYKQDIVRETLKRIGKIANPDVQPTLPSPKEWNWRSRVMLHGNEKGEIGFFRPKSYSVVDIEECKIADETVNAQLKNLRSQTRARKTDYEIRSTGQSGFTQVNPSQNENLKQLLKVWVQDLPHETIIELFCGGGNFTEVLAPMAKKITAVDSDRYCIDHAQATLSHFDALTLKCTDAVQFFAKQTEPIDLLLLDPPRDGAAGVVEGVLKTQPKNIIYISCNPATLARDLQFLRSFAGYHLVKNRPIDMFPHSFHIESISLLTCDPLPSTQPSIS